MTSAGKSFHHLNRCTTGMAPVLISLNVTVSIRYSHFTTYVSNTRTKKKPALRILYDAGAIMRQRRQSLLRVKYIINGEGGEGRGEVPNSFVNHRAALALLNIRGRYILLQREYEYIMYTLLEEPSLLNIVIESIRCTFITLY